LGYCLLVGMVVLRWRIARINPPQRCRCRVGVPKKVVSEWTGRVLKDEGAYLSCEFSVQAVENSVIGE